MSSSVAAGDRPRRSASNSPYSFSFQPRSSARSRSAMLCAFEPVKYCSAAPRCSGVTRRRSAWKPPRSSTLALVPPLAEHALDLREARERVGQRRVGAAGEDVEVAAGLAPRRTLPTVVMSAAGALFLQVRDQRVGHFGGARQQVTAGNRCRSSIAWRISCSFLRAHALDAADAAGLGRRGEVVEALDAQLACRAWRRSSARRPAGAADRAASPGNSVSSSRRMPQSPVVAISRMRPARSLPMPFQPRSAASSSDETGFGRVRRRCRRRCDTRES